MGFSYKDDLLKVWDMVAAINSSSNDAPSPPPLWQLRIGEGVGGWIVADEYQVYMFKGKRRSGVCQL